jgi:hypothetical protein
MQNKLYKKISPFFKSPNCLHQKLKFTICTMLITFLAQILIANAQFVGVSYDITEAGNPTEIFFPNNVLVSGNNTLDLNGFGGDLVISINTTTNKISFVSTGAVTWTTDFDLVFLNGATVSSISLASSTGTNANRVLISRSSGSTIAFRRQGGNEVTGSFTVVYDFVPVTTTTWNGTTWSNSVPVATVDAVIASNTAPTTFTCKALTINNGFSLNTNNIVVTTNGNIVNNGNGIVGTGVVQIRANGTISGNPITIAGRIDVGVINALTLTTGNLLRIAPGGRISGSYTNISGTVALQQSIIAQRGWRVFANPFTTTQNFSAIATANSIAINTSNGAAGIADVRSFSNATNQWNNAGTATTANQAYGLFIRGLANEVSGLNYTAGPTAFTYSVSGTLNGNSVSITPASSSNYLIVGNPYAAPVNTQALTGGSAAAYQTYQITQGGNQTLQRTRAGAWVPAGSNSNTTTTIPVLGALAYIPSSTSTFNVTISNINIAGTLATNLFTSNNNNIQQIGISIEQEGMLLDRIYIRQEQSNNQRLPKFKNDIANLYIKATDDKVLSIESKTQLKGKQLLGFTGTKGNYTLTVNENSLPINTTAILVDKYQKTETAINSSTQYNFAITDDEASQGDNRFEIVFNQTNTATVIEETLTNNNKVFAVKILGNIGNNRTVNLQLQNANNNQATLTVTDVQGKTISTKTITNGNNSINIPTAKGLYIVTVADGQNKVVEKVIR